MAEQQDEPLGWAILELMGHRRLAGFVSEQTVAGAAFIRIDVPDPTASPAGVPADEIPAATQLYSAAAVYAITPTTEAIAREAAKAWRPAPVSRWELPGLLPATTPPSCPDCVHPLVEHSSSGCLVYIDNNTGYCPCLRDVDGTLVPSDDKDLPA